MKSPVSPEYDFRAFCQRMIGNDPMDVMDAASAEAALAQRTHRERTGRWFRKGSRGRQYCDDLERLIYVLVNGSVPSETTMEFLIAAKPLVEDVLRRWDIANLRSAFAHVPAPDPDLRWFESADFLTVVASREQVLARDMQGVADVLGGLTALPEVALKWRDRVDFRIHGWDNSVEELFESPDVRDFVYKVDQIFPFWLFFLSKNTDSLKFVTLCFLPPYLTPAAKASEFPRRLDELLTKRWLPAMNDICTWVGMSAGDIDALTERVVDYFRD